MAPSVIGVDTGSSTTSANPTVSLSTTPVSGDVLIVSTFCGTSSAAFPSAVSGCGATWTRIPGAFTYNSGFWMGTGATSSGTITITAAADSNSRVARVHHLRGVSADAMFQSTQRPLRASSNQIAIGYGTSQSGAGTGINSWAPAQPVWTDQTEVLFSTNRRFNSTYHVPRFISDCNVSGALTGGTVVVGCPVPGATLTRRNQVPNSSNETSNTFSGINATANQSNAGDPSWSGTRSVKLTATAAAPVGYRIYSLAVPGPTVNEGQTYTASAYANSVNARNGRAIIRWKKFDGTLISTSNGSTTALPANTWTRLSITGATAPAAAVYAEPGVEITDGVNTDVTYLDGFLFEPGSTLSDYIDGYTATTDRINLFLGETSSVTPSADYFPTVQTTVPSAPSSGPSIVGVDSGSITTAANPTVTLSHTPSGGDVLILSDARGNTANAEATAVSGCGATWTKIGGGHTYMSFWIGTGATSTGTITATAAAATQGRALRVHHLRGVTQDVYIQQYLNTYPVMATPNQVVIAGCYSQSSTSAPVQSTTPAHLWTDDTEFAFASNRRYNTTRLVPSFPWTFNAAPDTYCTVLVIGSPVARTKVLRRNLCGNSSIESVTTDWLGSGTSTRSVAAGVSAVGASSITANYNASATAILRKGTGSNGPQGPAIPGRTYTVSCWVRCNSARTAGVVLMWLGLGQGINSTGTYGTLTSLPANTWTRVSWTGTAPAGTYWVAPEAKIEGCASGDVYWWDGFLIEEGTSTMGEYFDGMTAPPAGSDIQNYGVGASDLFQSVQLVPTLTKVMSRESGAWVDRSGAIPKAWNGSAWVVKRPKYWNGSAWVNL